MAERGREIELRGCSRSRGRLLSSSGDSRSVNIEGSGMLAALIDVKFWMQMGELQRPWRRRALQMTSYSRNPSKDRADVSCSSAPSSHHTIRSVFGSFIVFF